MAIEIERKFLVNPRSWTGIPEDVKKISRLRQAYLTTDPVRVVRVRTEEVTCYPNYPLPATIGYLTIKGKKVGASGQEWEYPIPFDEAVAMMKTVVLPNSIIEKIRYVLPLPGSPLLEIEVDHFQGRHQGMIVAEVELPNEDTEFEVPPWFGPEVTNDTFFSNLSLALAPEFHLHALNARFFK